MSNPKRLIRLPGMCAKFGGCSPSTIWRRVADGTISKPTKFGGMTLWDEDVVDEGIAAEQAEQAAPEAA